MIQAEGEKGIVIFCAKPAGVTALKTLVNEAAPINCIVTVPGEEETEFSTIAKQLNVPIFSGVNLKDPSEQDKILYQNTYAALSISYPNKIPSSLLEKFQGGAFNFHPARLPTYRGCLATIWPILNGDMNADYTMHIMDDGFDSGPVVDYETLPIEDGETGWSLYLRLVGVLPNLICRNLNAILLGRCKAVMQNEADSKYYPNRLPHDGKIDWNWDGNKLDRFVRALYHPVFSGAIARINNAEIEILNIGNVDRHTPIKAPGTVNIGAGRIGISCNDSWIILKTIRVEGKILTLHNLSETPSIFH